MTNKQKEKSEELFNEGAICPFCESGKLRLKKKRLEFEYKGNNSEITKEVFFCEECEEIVFKKKDEKAIERFLTDERRKVEHLLTSNEIKTIRNSFDATQEQFSKMLRVSKKNFARYESGTAMQGVAMDNQLRILRDYPEAIRSIPGQEDRFILGKKRETFPEDFKCPSSIVNSASSDFLFEDYKRKKETEKMLIQA